MDYHGYGMRKQSASWERAGRLVRPIATKAWAKARAMQMLSRRYIFLRERTFL